jgi:hypothetical protein
MLFNAAGSAYMMERRDAEVYAAPYTGNDGGAASAAVSAVMDNCDFGKLLDKVGQLVAVILASYDRCGGLWHAKFR